MDIDDLSGISEEEHSNEGKSNMVKRSDTDEEDTDSLISISNTLTQRSDQGLHQYEETAHYVDVTKESRSTVQNESTIVRGDGSSVGAISKSLGNIISVKEGNENLKTSQSMLSFTSTDAICGSSSSDMMSSEDELMYDFRNIKHKCESKDNSCSEKPILILPRTALVNMSSSASTTYSSGNELNKKSQTKDCTLIGSEGSPLQEESNSLKSLDIYNRLEAINRSSLPKGWLSNNFQSEKCPSKRRYSSTISSDKSSKIEELSSPNKKTAIVPPLLVKLPSKNRRDGIIEISEGGATGGFHDYDHNQQKYSQKEDKSVRRKVKTEYPTSSKTNSFSNSVASSKPLASSSPRKVGCSLLHMSKSLEPAPHKDDDWVIYDTHGRSSEVKSFSPKPWVKELISACQQIRNTDTIPELDTVRLLEEVQHFFQVNSVDADENLSWKQRKCQILTSKYFSDEFCRRHGLLSNEELVNEWLGNLENHTYKFVKYQMMELCRTLEESSLYEEFFIDYFKQRVSEANCDPYSLIEPSSHQHPQCYASKQFLTIEKDVGFHVMVELYKKLRIEGTSFLRILRESEEYPEGGFECRESLNISENSNIVPSEFLAGDRSTIFSSDYPTINQEVMQSEWNNVDCPSSNGAYMIRRDENATQLSRTDSRVSKGTSNVPSATDSNEFVTGSSQTDSRVSKKASNVPSATGSNEFVTGSSQTDSRVSKEASNVHSDSNAFNTSVTSDIEPRSGKTDKTHRRKEPPSLHKASEKSGETSNVVFVLESNAVDSSVTVEIESCDKDDSFES